MELTKNNITAQLIFRLKSGDMLAFDQIYKIYSHRLFSFVLKILKNEAEAEEIVQEVFVQIWENRQKIKDDRLLDSYIFTIAYNHSISLIRKRLNDQKYLDYLKTSSVLNENPSLISEVEYNELREKIDELIKKLPERQKEIFVMHREEGLTYAEIAEALGLSKNTVENHMSKALKFIRQNLNQSLLVHLLFIYLSVHLKLFPRIDCLQPIYNELVRCVKVSYLL